MKFKKLYAENIYSFQRLEIDFSDFSGATSIILGKNIDQKSANGAGKSSILKALYWNLWNEELNGANLDTIIRRGATTGALSIIEFEDRGHEYKITRYKNYIPRMDSPKLADGSPITGSGVEFLINGEPFHGDNHSATQKLILQKMRMTPKLFLSCVMMAQNTKEHFLTANDTAKKDLLAQMLDLGVYKKASDELKKYIPEVDGKISNAEHRAETLNEQILSNNQNIEKFKIDEATFTKDNDTKIKSLEMEITALKEQMLKLKSLAMEKDLGESIKLEIQALEKKQSNVKLKQQGEAKVQAAKISLESEIKNAKDNLEKNEERIKQIDLEIVKLVQQSSIVLNEENLDSLIKDKEALLNLNNQEVLQNKEELQKIKFLNTQLNDLSALLNKILKEEEKIKHQEEDLNKNGAFCPTCERDFKEGENASLDKVRGLILKSKEDNEKEKNQVLNQKKEVEKSLSLAKELLDKEQALLEKDLEIKSSLKILQEKQNEQKIIKEKIILFKQQAESLEKNKVQTDEESLKIKTKIFSFENKLKQVLELLKEFEPLNEELLSIEEKIKEKREALSKEEVRSIQIQQAKTSYNEKEESLNKKQDEKKELANKANPFSQMIQKLEVQNKDFQDKLLKLKEQVISLQDEKKYLEFWKIGFGPAGISSFVTDDVIDLLNRKTQENLNDLFDGAITVIFDPESKNNKGVVSNKISTTFLLNNKETPFELLSGGEAQRAILATELALTDVAEARAGTKMNIRFLDEPFNGIDDNGQVKSLVLFARLSRDKDGFFIISHEEKFQALCPKAVYVIKHKEVSKIVTRDVFNNVNIDSDEGDFSAGFDEGEMLELKPKRKKTLDDVSKKRKKELDEDDDV